MPLGNQIVKDNCFACHTLLKEQVDMGKGLHANPDFKDCITCHSEHHGREFKLIHWKEGQENFNHDLTGYKLEGAHANLECRVCHQAEKIQNKAKLLEKKKDLGRTFLGLEQACLSCHHDEHRAQLRTDCASCHDMDAWKPAPKFDHDKTNFPLTGKHIDVSCEKCHKTVVDNKFPDDDRFMKFTGLDFKLCVSCHTDVHEGQFGKNCESCHNTRGWDKINQSKFDHNKTRYPLLGEHQSLACESCHKPGQPYRGIAFENCMDCHTDFHEKQFAKREMKGACEECHTVDGFSPSTFTLEKHNLTDFPLEGSHLAIPCVACHAGGPPGAKKNRSMLKVNKFTFDGVACADCHKDPHKGEVDKFVQRSGCETCHHVDSWRKNLFDHNETKYALHYRHAEIECIACHEPVDVGGPRERIAFAGLSMECADCHEDIHQGQFMQVANVNGESRRITLCAHCHSEKRWEPDLFDHNRDAIFPLEGGHENVPCADCHFEAKKNGVKFAVFKPIETKCSRCHGD